MTLDEKVKAVLEDECCLDITSFFNIKGLKRAYIGLADYDCSRGDYEIYCNHHIKKEELEDYLLEIIPKIEKNLKDGFLGLDTQSVVFEFEGTDGKDKSICINSSEWLSVYLD